MTSQEFEEIRTLTLNARKNIIRMATNGGCFIGASLSCVDLIAYLYSQFLNISPKNYKQPERDYFFLSKGHAVPALYGVLVELGFFEKARLNNHLKTSDLIYWHPNPEIPGVEFYSGSLGHSLPIATGVALDIKMRQQPNRVVVMTGDGELNEGSNWEALLLAQAYKLDNLVVVVDRNVLQANLPTENLIPLEPLIQKFEAFGCAARRIGGHDLKSINGIFSEIPLEAGKPNVIIADTVRGKGLPGIEARADRWFYNFDETEIDALLAEVR